MPNDFPERKNQLAEVAPNEVTSIERMFNSVVELAKDPDVDPAKMTAIVDMQMKMMDYTKQETFNRDLAAAISEMPTITKDGAILDTDGNVKSRFSTFEHLYNVAKPILSRHNLLLTFDPGSTPDGTPTCATILSHTNGHVEKSGRMVIPMGKENRFTTRGMLGVGAITMGKRHTMKATLGIVEDSNDGTAPRIQYIEKEEWQAELISGAQSAATGGLEAFKAWFLSKTNMQRGYLVDSGTKAECEVSAREIDHMTTQDPNLGNED